eukprot:CAMPEP_0197569878 /NCGR_PEP_ID=MMETSP1320-20131121/39731_1 /TAXON_ID=91990 /ORGANISM="Bolidomonas sp., Strain RCC2347" /LENGTH=70 /DNA_ID=CAMNT_0043132279 /DNA_START=75 /DNA_END=284 /DNA_ORIENTATION=-
MAVVAAFKSSSFCLLVRGSPPLLSSMSSYSPSNTSWHCAMLTCLSSSLSAYLSNSCLMFDHRMLQQSCSQ